MRKLYFLLLSILPFIGVSQGSINFDTDANWTQGGGGTPAAFSSYSDHIYTDGVFSATGLEILRNTTAAQDGFPGALDTYAIRLKNTATTEFTMSIASGGVGTFSFSVRRWDASPDTNFAVEYSTDGGTNWIASSTINASITSDSDWKTVNGTINSANNNIKIRIKSNGATERIMVDNFNWTSPSSNPSLLISSPANATVFNPITSTVTVNLSVSNFAVGNPGTGIDGHIHYTVNGANQPMKYDTNPITLSGLTPGTYVVMVMLVDNNHNPITPAVNATVTFEIAALNVVSNLTALRADVIANGVGKYYQVSSNPVITYARTTRNQKYIQDATAGILIDDVPGTITTTMIAGDAITGLKGQASLYGGVLQLLPLENASIASSGNTVVPQVVTATDITSNVEAYESELVQINNATFTAADGTLLFATNTNTNLNDGTDIVFRPLFAEADYIGQVIPAGAANRVVLVAEFNGTVQVVARSITDVTLTATSFDQIEGLTMYPNPVSGTTVHFTSSANATMGVQVFDLLGKEVLNANVVNTTVNIAKLTAGIYVVKITEAGKIATRKLVIK